ncbi:hypothetical protein EGR52_13315 [bacterium]|nr:hypothetical protein [bacterium]
MNEIKALNEMYKVVEMGIIGIDNVYEKLEDKTLVKTMLDAKKKYQVYKVDLAKMLNSYGEDKKGINVFIKMFNDIHTSVDLINKDDMKIIEMLIEGTNKGILKLEEILNEDLENDVIDIARNILELLEFQIKKWKEYL